MDKKYTMADLLEETAKIGIDRVRFVTSHPWDFTDDMLEVIAKYDNIMPYIHLPIQSGSDRILKLMGRRYTKEEYIALYNKIRETIPGVSITTDIIVGFPNESEEAFKNTLDVVDTCHYDAAFTFIFSPREGTPAARMEDKVDMETKHRRLEELIAHINKDALARNKEYEGKIVKVLVEGESKRNDDILTGYSESQKLVNFKGNPSSIGKIVNVKITGIEILIKGKNKTIIYNIDSLIYGGYNEQYCFATQAKARAECDRRNGKGGK